MGEGIPAPFHIVRLRDLFGRDLDPRIDADPVSEDSRPSAAYLTEGLAVRTTLEQLGLSTDPPPLAPVGRPAARTARG